MLQKKGVYLLFKEYPYVGVVKVSLTDKILSEILKELTGLNKEMQGLSQKMDLLANRTDSTGNALAQMAEHLRDYQGIVDFAVKDAAKNNERFLRELKSQFTRLAVLFNPDLVGACRSATKIISSDLDPVIEKQYKIRMAENAVFGTVLTNRAFYRIGFLFGLSTAAYQPFDEGFHTEPGTAQNLRVVSTSANDASGGTGVRTLLLEGLDQNYNRVFESITMNGTTPVISVNQFTQFSGIFATSVGSNGFAFGEITATNLANTITFGHIAPGFNIWRSGRFHTAANDVGYVHSWCFGSYNATVRAELWASNTSGFSTGTIIAWAMGIANNDNHLVIFPIPIRVVNQGKILVRGIAKGPNNEVTTSFQLYTRAE